MVGHSQKLHKVVVAIVHKVVIAIVQSASPFPGLVHGVSTETSIQQDRVKSLYHPAFTSDFEIGTLVSLSHKLYNNRCTRFRERPFNARTMLGLFQRRMRLLVARAPSLVAIVFGTRGSQVNPPKASKRIRIHTVFNNGETTDSDQKI